MGKTIEPLYGGETSRRRVNAIAEVKDAIVNTILGILAHLIMHSSITIRLHVRKDTLIYGISRSF